MYIAFMGNPVFSKLNFKNNPYAQPDFVKNNRIPQETQIIENIADELQKSSSEINKNNILYSIGRIFEKADAFDIAKTFYETLKSSPNLSRKEAEDLDFDIKRINEKSAAESEKYWEV